MPMENSARQYGNKKPLGATALMQAVRKISRGLTARPSITPTPPGGSRQTSVPGVPGLLMVRPK